MLEGCAGERRVTLEADWPLRLRLLTFVVKTGVVEDWCLHGFSLCFFVPACFVRWGFGDVGVFVCPIDARVTRRAYK